MATSSVELSANGQMYKQLYGVAMDSRLGPTLANIFVWFREAGKMSRPLFYCRYVDDCFAMFKKNDLSAQFYFHLNQMYPALQFRSESEENNQIPYLYVMVIRKNGKILSTVYRKPTFSGQYVKLNSFCHDSRKIRLIKTLTPRALLICSPSLLEL